MQPESNQQETSKTEEEEEESEKEGDVLTSTGNTKGTPTLTATGTSSNGDLNVGGLRRSTRAALKTPANPNILKGATVPTPDPTEHALMNSIHQDQEVTTAITLQGDYSGFKAKKDLMAVEVSEKSIDNCCSIGIDKSVDNCCSIRIDHYLLTQN
ncbi:hypothetical protein MJO28_010789 [Puccinia striiformis f. sp. tritici]|uniref:Uncharacterized protein n=1 Tax=Puccinia striiformis f. sp. tritici TaxID=168172 RepID=A0ACC0E7L2_9BASI|nr:hypothetical protein MJO28_010789 [Puccinia striiformis f. sp. tritici]